MMQEEKRRQRGWGGLLEWTGGGSLELAVTLTNAPRQLESTGEGSIVRR